MVRTRSRSTTHVHARQAARCARGCTERHTRDHSRRITHMCDERIMRRYTTACAHRGGSRLLSWPCTIMPRALSLAEVHESRACTGRAPLSTAPPLHGMSARPLLAAASTLPPVRHARVLSHARCGACGGVLPRQDSRPTACTCGSLSLPRRGASARMRRRASLTRERGGGRESRAPRSARPDPTRAHPAEAAWGLTAIAARAHRAAPLS